ncbi:MAG: glycosyltransferase family 2 protein [Myxococcales bacterium]|nr:glycosyltransferase family 2 protein [Myxococcales bacterium]
MFRSQRVALIIPCLDEEKAIGGVVREVDRAVVDDIIVVNNGSVDRSAERAAEAGAIVLSEPHQGYGSACLLGIAEARRRGAELYVFMDGDGSDDPRQLESLLRKLDDERLDLVIGSRVLGEPEPGALTPVQLFGNSLTCQLVRLFWGVSFTDLGPFRAITAAALARLEMADPDFGWTIEMQVKAAQRGLRVGEVPMRYRVRRHGKSKVSGTLRGTYMAGKRILGYVFTAKLVEVAPRFSSRLGISEREARMTAARRAHAALASEVEGGGR